MGCRRRPASAGVLRPWREQSGRHRAPRPPRSCAPRTRDRGISHLACRAMTGIVRWTAICALLAGPPRCWRSGPAASSTSLAWWRGSRRGCWSRPAALWAEAAAAPHRHGPPGARGRRRSLPLDDGSIGWAPLAGPGAGRRPARAALPWCADRRGGLPHPCPARRLVEPALCAGSPRCGRLRDIEGAAASGLRGAAPRRQRGRAAGQPRLGLLERNGRGRRDRARPRGSASRRGSGAPSSCRPRRPRRRCRSAPPST